MAADGDKDAAIARLQARVQELEEENSRLAEQLVHVRSVALPPLHRTPSASGGSMTSGRPTSARPAGSPDAGRLLANSDDASTSDGKAAEGSCDNCGQAVPPSAFAMHRAYCVRNVGRCKHCGEVLKLSDLEAHLAANAGTPAALHAAAAAGDFPALERMLRHGGSSSDPLASTGDALIHTATRARQVGVIDLLLSRGVSINAGNASGESPLHIACGMHVEQGVHDIVAHLIAHGCDVDARTALGDTVMQVAQKAGNLDVLVLLSSTGGTLRPSSRDGRQRPASASSLTRLRPPSAGSGRSSTGLPDSDSKFADGGGTPKATPVARSLTSNSAAAGVPPQTLQRGSSGSFSDGTPAFSRPPSASRMSASRDAPVRAVRL